MHPRQKEFLELTCEEALYGGAAGGGKTEALLRWLGQGYDTPGFSGLFLRRTYPQLSKSNDSPIMRSFRIYTPLGGRYHASDHKWVFPSGAIIEFGHMQYESSVADYTGPSYHRIAFDELTQFSETQYGFMFSRIRKQIGFPIPLGIRAATNPGGPGHNWVRKRFISNEAQAMVKQLTYRDPSPRGVFTSPTGQVFVPARVADNPSLDVDDYITRMLGSLPPKLREQMASGDWDAVEGALIDVGNIARYSMEGDYLCALDTMGKKTHIAQTVNISRFATIDTAGTAEIKTAHKTKPRASSVIAIWDFDKRSKTLYLRHVWRGKVEWAGLKSAFVNTLMTWAPKKVYIENAHVGPALVSEFKNQFRLELMSTRLEDMRVNGDGAKLNRAIAGGLFEFIDQGRLRLPAYGLVPGVDLWLEEYERELMAWTGSPDEPSDQIDVTSYACDRAESAVGKVWGGVIRG